MHNGCLTESEARWSFRGIMAIFVICAIVSISLAACGGTLGAHRQKEECPKEYTEDYASCTMALNEARIRVAQLENSEDERIALQQALMRCSYKLDASLSKSR